MTAAFRTLTLAIASVLGLVAFESARADHGYALGRIDNLSREIQSESRELYYEIRSVSFSNPELRSAQSEVGQIYQLASRIHDAVHGSGSMYGMDRNVHSIERLVHHVDDHLIGYGHFRRHVDRLDSLTHDLEDAIHDLDDIYSSPVYSGPVYTGPVYTGPAYSTRPGVSYGSSGITIGGRGFSFTIGR
jgi:hypothetical protein